MEQQYRTKLRRLNNIARKNSNCRGDKNLISCQMCDDLDKCNINGYDEALEDLRKIESKIDIDTKIKIREEER